MIKVSSSVEWDLVRVSFIIISWTLRRTTNSFCKQLVNCIWRLLFQKGINPQICTFLENYSIYVECIATFFLKIASYWDIIFSQKLVETTSSCGLKCKNWALLGFVTLSDSFSRLAFYKRSRTLVLAIANFFLVNARWISNCWKVIHTTDLLLIVGLIHTPNQD